MKTNWKHTALMGFISGTVAGLIVWATVPTNDLPQPQVTMQREVIRYIMRPPFVVGDCIQKESWESVYKVTKVGKQDFMLEIVTPSTDEYANIHPIGKREALYFYSSEYHSIVKCP